jgi:copper resistance protein B
MKRFASLALAPLVFGPPAAAQSMAGMPGMSMPTRPADKVSKAHTKVPPPVPATHRRRQQPVRGAAATSGAVTDHAMLGMPSPPAGGGMAGMPMPAAAVAGVASPTGMAGMDMSGAAQDQPSGRHDMAGMSEPESPDAPPPRAPTDLAADRYYDPAAMASARATLRQEHGGDRLSLVMANLAEYQTGRGGGGYRWDGQAYFGGDINGLALTSEGSGASRTGLESAELQALYSRAVTPYFDLHAGVRQDFAPRGQTYATVGFQGTTPGWFDVQGAVFISAQGELLGRLEGSYDLRLTQRLVLQPRAELNFAAKDTPATQTGSGLSEAELGLRLRYEIRRTFAPYIGIAYDAEAGKTADFARNRGEDVGGASFVAGVRAWF